MGEAGARLLELGAPRWRRVPAVPAPARRCDACGLSGGEGGGEAGEPHAVAGAWTRRPPPPAPPWRLPLPLLLDDEVLRLLRCREPDGERE